MRSCLVDGLLVRGLSTSSSLKSFIVILCFSVREVVRNPACKGVKSIVAGEAQPHPLAMSAMIADDLLLSKPVGQPLALVSDKIIIIMGVTNP